MKTFVIIGLGQFGQCMLDALNERGLQTLVIDQDEAKVQWARDRATKAVKADALNLALFEELIDETIDCAIIDLGELMERSILAANYLHKLQVPHIVVEANSAAHAEILEIVGATRIVFPEKEAAQRLAGLLAGRGRLDYFPVGKAFSLVEVAVPAAWAGRTLAQLDVRKKHHLNIVAVRHKPEQSDEVEWNFPNPEMELRPDDVVLLAGQVERLEKFTR